MKKAGIIGGLGPETTAKFYMEVIFACSKISEQRPNIVISNVSLPLDVEKEVITEAKNKERLLPFLIVSAKQLEKSGADFIVIPCNTVHVFIDQIRKSVKIPVLSIVDETVDFLASKHINKVGLLGTKITVEEHLFDEKLKKNGTELIALTERDQKKLGEIINHLVNSSQTNKDKIKLLRIIENHTLKNTDCILLACTDLQLLIRYHREIKIFDTLDILKEATIRKITS